MNPKPKTLAEYKGLMAKAKEIGARVSNMSDEQFAAGLTEVNARSPGNRVIQNMLAISNKEKSPSGPA